MRFHTILFDLDGTLLNTTPLILSSFLHTVNRHCPEKKIGEQEVIACLGEPLRDQMVRFGGEERAEAMVQTYREHNVAHHDELVEAFPGVPEVLADLWRRGLRMAVVSNKQRQTVEMGLKLCRLEEFFSEVICFGDAEKPKPDGAPIRLAMDRLDGKPATTLMVGDSKYDLLAARDADVPGAGVAWTAHGRESLLAYQPEYMLESMEDLYEIIGLQPVEGDRER
ncbi:pyrophosphatase PpaX [Kroppenstedtia eburnea]|uniref:Pyrophosphatase PpaX n=1 Tax=Kroppenstedtia eburnea TaxID=714067 RepID=A0A1N7JVI4_9BACL|nr:pyrophosphatase PpaX [Kroppenstedtia eburnea]QKI83420.1 pyrophosphatase PpaX [Kroppenstedtia eburnea]SIS53291.1 pyrophosphatase PpaX [Kroppenstedtia eburnea]